MPWQILQAIAAALALISTANGYRTDIGANVSLEAVQDPAATKEGIVLGTLAITRPNLPDNKNPNLQQRSFDFIVEAAVPISPSDGVVPAFQRMHDVIEDIEQALDPMPLVKGALRPQFSEIAILDRPNGLNAVVAQCIFSVDYRR